METRVRPAVAFAAFANQQPVRKQVEAQPTQFGHQTTVASPGAPAQKSSLPTTAQYLSFLGNVKFGQAMKTTSDKLPLAPRDFTVVENLHGHEVADPFRPLENLDAKPTTDWWRAQNKRTQAYLDGAKADHAAAVKWHEEIRDYTRESLPYRRGKNWFFSRQAGLDPQPTYYVRKGRKAAEEVVLIDPNKLSDNGTVALSTMNVSPNGKLVAYTVSEAGSDWQTMRFKDVETGEDVYEELTGLRFTDATWDADGKGVIYTKPVPGEEGHFGVYHHTLGQKQSTDAELHKRTDVPESFVGAFRVRPEDKVLFVTVGSGTNPENGLYFRKPGQADLTEVLPPGKAAVAPFYRDGDTLYATTDLDAPTQRVVKIDMNNPASENWETVVAETKTPGAKLNYAFVSGGDKLFVAWKEGGVDKIEVRTLDGKVLHDMPIPTGSTVYGFGQVRPNDRAFNIQLGGYLTPGTTYRYNIKNNDLTFVKKSNIARDLSDVAEVQRIFATSKDGTKVPMWVIKPKDLPMDGNAATILYAYGGFNVPLEPAFSYGIMHWVEQGGVFVVANLRGGGEFGREWYDGGRLKNKQNVFDDFAACAEKLVEDGYTKPERLAIKGGSNGGLLTAATSQQYPDHFGAVVSQVPVTDLFRFQTNNYGAAWKSDYGDPEVKEDFEVSRLYSPLHNVASAEDVTYPPTLITTGDHDDRVAPWHAFKWAATRQEQGHQANTYLLVEEDAGHGAGKPTAKVIDEAADEYAFLVQTLGAVNPDANK